MPAELLQHRLWHSFCVAIVHMSVHFVSYSMVRGSYILMTVMCMQLLHFLHVNLLRLAPCTMSRIHLVYHTMLCITRVQILAWALFNCTVCRYLYLDYLSPLSTWQCLRNPLKSVGIGGVCFSRSLQCSLHKASMNEVHQDWSHDSTLNHIVHI